MGAEKHGSMRNSDYRPTNAANACANLIIDGALENTRIVIDKPLLKQNHPEGQTIDDQQQRMDGELARIREGICTKIATLLGTLLLVFLDLFRWLCLRRKCIQGQTVVITGGASGIGMRLAQLFADPNKIGAKVAIIDSNLGGAEKVAQEILKRNGCAHAWKCDIVDAEAMRKCAAEIHKYFGGVDIVICNAAILYFGYTMELRDEEIQRALDVNVWGTINTIRAFLPDMEMRGRGHIVAISSIAGFFGETFGMAYCPTKFAVRGVMECLRMELYDRGMQDRIVCTTICPFFVRTPMILSKGLRPVSRWIPFMSVKRCANMIVDAILKEKVLAFMPFWLALLTTINSLFSLNMQRVARDFINCRYEEPDDDAQRTHSNGTAHPNVQNCKEEVLAKCPENGTKRNPMNGGCLLPPNGCCRPIANSPLKQRHQMRDYFAFADVIWWLFIPSALLLNLVVFCSPEKLDVPWLGVFGQFLYKLGIEHPQMMFWLNIFALSAHVFEAICALYLADALHLSHKSSLAWFLQTFVLGYPSLRLLLKLWHKEQ